MHVVPASRPACALSCISPQFCTPSSTKVTFLFGLWTSSPSQTLHTGYVGAAVPPGTNLVGFKLAEGLTDSDGVSLGFQEGFTLIVGTAEGISDGDMLCVGSAVGLEEGLELAQPPQLPCCSIVKTKSLQTGTGKSPA